MSQVLPIYINSDHALFFNDVKDRDGNPITDGTCTYVITTKYPINGVILTLDSGDLTWDTTRSQYEKIIDKTITANVVKGRRYIATITFTDPLGEDVEEQQELRGAHKGRE